jgi:hypothetical protein
MAAGMAGATGAISFGQSENGNSALPKESSIISQIFTPRKCAEYHHTLDFTGNYNR